MADILREHVAGKFGEEFVFTSFRGYQIRPNNFKRRDYDTAVQVVNTLAAVSKANGAKDPVTIPKGLWVHDLRHTAASWLVQSGASVKAVQRQLGHATASITLDVYAGLFDQDLDDLSVRMQSLLVPGMPSAA